MTTGRDGPGTRLRILEFVRANPGMHKSELCRRLELSWGTVGYHMRHLETRGELAVFSDRREVRLFPAGTPERHMRWISALRQAEGSNILDVVARSPGRGIAELSRELSTSRKIVRRHLTALDEAGVLTMQGQARPRFQLGDDEALVLARTLGMAPRAPEAPAWGSAAPADGPKPGA